jgi:hypothetical protein
LIQALHEASALGAKIVDSYSNACVKVAKIGEELRISEQGIEGLWALVATGNENFGARARTGDETSEVAAACAGEVVRR